ncbi:MAG: sugar phosphate nucleotidyltransferase [Planctomycetota bacterium]
MRRKQRLTITLTPDLVRQIDRLIDKRTVRSRSHAIEMLLRRTLAPTVETAVLLAGGPGEADDVPALTTIRGEALISLTIRHLMSAGIRSFVILAGDNEAAIRQVLGEGSRPESRLATRIHYVREDKPLGTAGALKQAEPLLAGGPFLMVHADVLTNIDIESFINFHMRENTLATIAVKPRQAERQYGKVLLEGNRILEFIEKGDNQGISIVNTGVYLFRPEILSLIDADGPSHLETDVFPRLAGMRELGAFLFQGIWFDISTPENRGLAEARWCQDGGYGHVRYEANRDEPVEPESNRQADGLPSAG